MLDLLKGDVREGEGGRALGLLRLEIDVMPPINAVIVRRRLGLVERVGDLGSLRVIDVYDLDGSRAFRDETKAFFSIMRIGFVDRGFKSHAAVPRGDFSLRRNGFRFLGLLFKQAFPGAFRGFYASGVMDFAHSRLASKAASKSEASIDFFSSRRRKRSRRGAGVLGETDKVLL